MAASSANNPCGVLRPGRRRPGPKHGRRRPGQGPDRLAVQRLEPRWALSGVPALVKDIYPVLGSGAITDLAQAGETFYFQGYGSTPGLWKTNLTSSGTVFVKNVASVRNVVDLGNGIVVFTAYTAAAGQELWRTDGTEAGTYLLRDIRPGPQSPFAEIFSEGPGVVDAQSTFEKLVFGNVLIFAAEDSGDGNFSTATGKELWRTDGTVAGTQLLRNINPETSNPRTIRGSSPSRFRAVGPYVLFTATDASGGEELWRTNGIPGVAGTIRVKDIQPGGTGSSPRELTVVGSLLYFTADDGINGRELWRSDGTEAGTQLVADIHPTGSSAPQNLQLIGETLYFSADDGVHGRELWKSDGTAAGTVRVTDINPGSGSSSPGGVVALGATLFFSANDGTSGSELWKTDGTEAGTARVKDVRSGSASSSPSSLRAVGSTLFFNADDGLTGRELWKTDGTEAGTMLVGDFRPGSDPSNPQPLHLTGSTLFFRVTIGVDIDIPLYALWRTDGTEAGTVLLNAGGPDIRQPGNLIPTSDGAIYIAHGETNERSGPAIWRADLTPSLPERLVYVPGDGFGSNPERLTPLGSNLFFTAASDRTAASRSVWRTDGTQAGTASVGQGTRVLGADGSTQFFLKPEPSGAALWKSDGTEAGTRQVFAFNRPLSDTFELDLSQFVGSTLYFTNPTTDRAGAELWRTDGTAAGTTLVKAMPAGQRIEDLTSTSSRLYFTWGASSGPRHLWTTDGTEAGTAQLTSVLSQNLRMVGGALFFVVGNAGAQNGLWRSDGTVAGTVQVRPLNNFGSFAAIGETLYFSAEDSRGRELWKSDGTEAGTVLVKDIMTVANNNSSSPDNLTVVGDTLFFSAFTESGRELWKSDGTEAGTVMVKDLFAGSSSAAPNNLRAVGSTLWFEATDGTGRTAWRTDGTEAGTVPLSSLWPAIGTVTNITTNGALTHFVGFDAATSARKIWSSDGTEAGTVALADISNLVPRTDRSLVLAGSKLYFSASDGINGQELWVVSTAAPASAAPPKVTGVFVRGGGWNTSYLGLDSFTTIDGASLGWRLPDGTEQLADASAVAWSNVNRIAVSFDQPIDAPQASALRIVSGSATGDVVVTPTSVTLLAGGTVAEWTLPADLGSARAIVSLPSAGITAAAGGLALDGEWVDGASTFAAGSGDGQPGGIFNFAFNVLVGDFNGNGIANALDISYLRQRLGTVSTSNFRLDLNGNNQINALDVAGLRQRLGSATGTRLADLPAPTPPTEAVPSGTEGSASGQALPLDVWAWFALESEASALSSQTTKKQSLIAYSI